MTNKHGIYKCIVEKIHFACIEVTIMSKMTKKKKKKKNLRTITCTMIGCRTQILRGLQATLED